MSGVYVQEVMLGSNLGSDVTGVCVQEMMSGVYVQEVMLGV